MDINSFYNQKQTNKPERNPHREALEDLVELGCKIEMKPVI